MFTSEILKVSNFPANPASRRALWAYLAPFGVFMVFQMLPDLLKHRMTAPEQWIYPLQTVVCAGVLLRFRREYPLRSHLGALVIGGLVGAVVLAIWVSPQVIFHFAPRLEGFNPEPLQGTPWYGAAVGARFVRLVLVVPLLEEIFWRGFLMRYLVKEDFASVPFGTYTHLSFWAVAVGFMLEHTRPDWPAALVTGVLYNLVAVRTRSLLACVLAHAVTNLLLGVYIMETKQWGFW